MVQKHPTPKKKRTKRRKHKKFSLLKYLLLFILLCAIGSGLFIYSVYAGLWGKLPNYAELRDIRNAEASELYTEDGVLIGKYYIENRTNVNFNNISPFAIQALI